MEADVEVTADLVYLELAVKITANLIGKILYDVLKSLICIDNGFILLSLPLPYQHRLCLS